MKEVEYQIKNINKLVDTSNEYLTDEDREGSTIILKHQQVRVKPLWFRKQLQEL